MSKHYREVVAFQIEKCIILKRIWTGCNECMIGINGSFNKLRDPRSSDISARDRFGRHNIAIETNLTSSNGHQNDTD